MLLTVNMLSDLAVCVANTLSTVMLLTVNMLSDLAVCVANTLSTVMLLTVNCHVIDCQHAVKCLACPDSQLSTGERHDPGTNASALNIHCGNLRLGQVMRALCKGIVPNMHA